MCGCDVNAAIMGPMDFRGAEWSWEGVMKLVQGLYRGFKAAELIFCLKSATEHCDEAHGGLETMRDTAVQFRLDFK